MPLLCIKCDTRVTGSLVRPTFYCPECDKELERKEVYRVGNRFFQREPKELRDEKIRQKRKKLKGLKMRQKKHTRR